MPVFTRNTIKRCVMEVTDRKVKTSKRNFIIAMALLLLTNVLMGITLMAMEKKTLREQIDQRMLDIANTAAYQLDGDMLKNLTADDEGTEGYNAALETLRSFQENIELDYIYGIRAEDDGTFTFTIDPAVEDPGEFGSPIKTTDALKQAAKGKPSVDKEAYSDAWGKFYSAYSPVFDSEGNIAGIVGVDFNADWYDGKLSSHLSVAIILIAVTLTIGIALGFIIMSQNRKRFSAMLRKMAELEKETQKLDNHIMENSIKKLSMLPENKSALLKTLATGEEKKEVTLNEYDELNTSIDAVNKKLQKYMKYLDSELYNDSTTGVSNKAAYKLKLKELEERIAAGNAVFSVAFFDINGFDKVYTNSGYEIGDQILFECADILKAVYGKSNVFHILGDEFIVIVTDKSRFEVEETFSAFDEKIAEYNHQKGKEAKLSVAKGFAEFDKDKLGDYRHTFIEAKKNCDADKAAYYAKYVR